MPKLTMLVVACAVSLTLAAGLRGDEETRTKAQVISAGRSFLLKDPASWEKRQFGPHFSGGPRLLATLALLETGSKADAPEVAESIAWAAAQDLDKTYLVGLQLAVLARVDAKAYRPQMERQVAWLVQNAIVRDDQWAWSYPIKGTQTLPDLSNTQFAVLGLHAAAKAGVPVDRKVWLGVRAQLLAVQLPSGGFSYALDSRHTDERVTMTAAGVYCLAVCQQHLDQRHTAATQALDRALGRFTLRLKPQESLQEYYLGYALKRACTLAKRDEVDLGTGGMVDWRDVWFRRLRGKQLPDGSWQGQGAFGTPVVATSLALLSLAD